MNKKIIAAAVLTVGCTASSGFAAAQNADRAGWYGGLDLGHAKLGLSGGDIDSALANQGVAGTSTLDTSDKSYGINGGYRFNRNFAAEAAWESLGSYNYSSNTGADTINGKFKADAFSLAGVGIYPFTPNWSVYGKLGLAHASAKLEAGSSTGATAVSNSSHSGTGPLLGAGLRYDFEGGVFTRLGWDRYDRVGDAASTGKGSIDLYQLGIGMQF
jgi:OOP family OmpA-OmpF porin